MNTASLRRLLENAWTSCRSSFQVWQMTAVSRTLVETTSLQGIALCSNAIEELRTLYMTLRKTAHALKGMCNAVGAHSMATLCQ